MMNDTQQPDLLPLVAHLVSAHVANNTVEAVVLPELIRSVYQTLSGLGGPPQPTARTKLTPAVPIKKSVFPDHIVCLEDGLKFQSMKRHLSTAHGMTPDEYRERWGLSAEYPVVASNYGQKRSGLAKAAGLGRRSSTTVEAAPVEETSVSNIPEVQRVPEGFSGLKKVRLRLAAE